MKPPGFLAAGQNVADICELSTSSGSSQLETCDRQDSNISKVPFYFVEHHLNYAHTHTHGGVTIKEQCACFSFGKSLSFMVPYENHKIIIYISSSLLFKALPS